jgi:hypothetical protein
MRKRSRKRAFFAVFQPHQRRHDVIHVQFLGNAHVSQRGRQSALRLASDEFACQAIVDDELGVVRVGGANACNLQHGITSRVQS